MKKNKLLFLVTVLVYLFLIGPLVVIMAASFSDTNYLKFPGEGFTLRWYQQVFTMSAFAKAAKLSLFIALGGTAICLLYTSISPRWARGVLQATLTSGSMRAAAFCSPDL